jgi:hypothetical protein
MARILFTAGALVATAGRPAHASAWTASATTGGGVGYDDNVLFVADQPIHDYYGRLDASASLQYVGNHSKVELQPRLAAYDYRSFTLYNRVDQFFKATLGQTTERGKSELFISGSRDTTLTSEVGSTGLTETNRRHNGLQAGWAPEYQATEQVHFGAQFSAQGNRYLDAAQTSLLDYDYGSAAANASYAVTPLASLQLQLSGGRLQVPGQPLRTTKNYAATLGYTRQLGPLWLLDAYIGPSWIQTRTLAGASRGEVYALDATRTSERGTLSLKLHQEVTPNGFGVLSRTQQGTLTMRHSATEHLSFGIAGRWSRTRNLLPLFGFELSRLAYNDFTASADWAPAATWYLSLSVGHGQQGYLNAPQPARRTHAALAFVWTGLERVLH